MACQGYPVTIQPSGVSSLRVSRYSGCPVSPLRTDLPLNEPRVFASRTSRTRSVPNTALKIASGCEAIKASIVEPGSILPSAGHCSATNVTSGRLAVRSSLNLATKEVPNS